MNIDVALTKLSTYPHIVLTWIDDDGYPMQIPASFESDAADGVVRIAPTGMPVPADRDVNVIGSHIRPQPGTGYDERRYVTMHGRAERHDSGATIFRPARAWGWDEKEMPFFEYSERSNEQARTYLAQISEEQGRIVKPRLSRVWTVLLSTRLPFLTATIVPILLGLAVAARDGGFNWWLAILTMLGGCAIHIGLNTANDVFDALSGADEANVNPTQYSGGSRVIQRGLVTLRQMGAVSIGAYAVGIAVGLLLLALRPSWELLAIGVAGVLLSVFYTAPPFKLVYRGLGEITTAIGFGPLMVLGAYVVQREALSGEAFVASIPVAILIALILYVNEIPDRNSDALAGKRTLPTRLSPEVVTNGFLVAAILAFAVVAIGGATGVLPRPTLIALIAAPMALSVYRGIRAHYGDPYTLMASMGKNVQVHLITGLLLFAGYLITLGAEAWMDSPPGILT